MDQEAGHRDHPGGRWPHEDKGVGKALSKVKEERRASRSFMQPPIYVQK